MVQISRMTPAGGRTYCGRTQIRPTASRIVIHHTWSPNSAQYRGLSTVEAIQRYHVQERGWRDIGYHFLVGPDGWCYNGRPMTDYGAHCTGQNGQIGIAAIANFDDEDPWAWGGMGQLIFCCDILLRRMGSGSEDVRFHREFAEKSCPGNRLDLREFRARLEAMEGPSVPDRSRPKVVRWPGGPSDLIDCHAEIANGVTRADLRPVVEALGWGLVEPVEEHLRQQGKIYLRRRPADG